VGISAQTFYRWRREFGGLKVEQANRLKALQQGIFREPREEAELSRDKLTLRETERGNLIKENEYLKIHNFKDGDFQNSERCRGIGFHR
jgi:putative transposase